MAIKFPTTGTRVAQGIIFKDLEPPRPEPATGQHNGPLVPLEAARSTTHAQEHGWST
jgi:hypothetical protein